MENKIDYNASKKILLVEDFAGGDSTTPRSLTDLLDKEDGIDLVMDIKSGIEKLSESKYDLVVTDLGLPYTTEPCADDFYRQKGITSKEAGRQDIGRSNNKDFLEEYSQKLKEKINQYSLKEIRDNASKKGIPLPKVDSRHGYTDEERLVDASGGVLIVDKAKENQIPTYIFTDIRHYKNAILGATVTENISLEQANDIFTELNLMYIPKEGFLKTGNLYVGRKSAPEYFMNVIKDALRYQSK